MGSPELIVVCWRGHGVVPVLVRALTWRPGMKWSETPAHVSIYRAQGDGMFEEIEAVVTGVRLTRNMILPSYGVVGKFAIPDPSGAGWDAALGRVGEPYGFAAAILTGAGSIVGLRDWATQWWRKLGQGRTAPQDCATLATLAIEATGLDVHEPETPISPAELMRWLKYREA